VLNHEIQRLLKRKEKLLSNMDNMRSAILISFEGVLAIRGIWHNCAPPKTNLITGFLDKLGML